MADNKLELVVEVDVGKANASIKSINSGLSSIEQAAARTARGASSGIDGITVSMVKGATAGNLLADTIKKAVEFAKEWTVGAAQYAAHTSKMESVTRALAAAHGEGSAAAQKAVESIKQIGFTTQEAQGAVQKMIIADLNLSKATGLAKIAKDAAAVSTEGLSASDAFEKIMIAIESGASRGLRQLGLFVDLNKEVEYEQLRLGRTLSETEAEQVRYNAIVREAAKIQGAHANTASEAETQMGNLKRSIDELRDSVGHQFQEQFKSTIGIFKDLVGFLRDNSDYLAKFGQAALWVAGVLSTYALASKIMDLAKSVAALRLASLNPYALLGAGVVAAGAIVYGEYKGMGEQREQWFAKQQKNSIRDAVGSGKSLAQLKAMGYSEDDIREAMTGKKTVEPGDFGNFGKVNVLGSGKPSVDQLKLAAEIRKKQAEAERASADAAAQAKAKSSLGFAKDIGEVNAQMQKWTTFVDDKGVEQHFKLTQKAWENVIEELRAKFTGYLHDVTLKNKEAAAEYLKDLKESNDRAIEYESHRYQQRLQFDEEWASKAVEHVQQVYAFEEQRAGYDRDAKLRQVEAADAQTLAQKLRAEQQKADIEVEYLERTHEVKLRLFDAETSTMVMQYQLQMRMLGYQADEIDRRIADFTQQRDEIRWQQQEATDAAVTAAKENASVRQAQMVRDQYRSIFSSLKEQAGGVFDALLSKSKSVWSAMGDAFKTAILTAIKEIVTSRIAAMLMQLFTGTSVSFAQGGVGGGGLGKLGGILGIGAVPMFGGGGGGMVNLSQMLGPGGTSGFAGPLQSMAPGLIGVGQTSDGQMVLAPLQGGMGVASLGSKFAGALPAGLSLAGLMMLANGMRGGTGAMPTINRIGGSAMLGAGAGMLLGPMLGATAGFGAAVGLPVGIGAGLMADAWKRGGYVGMGEAVGGGALAGATIGSIFPGIGTAIGAAIGAGVGLVEGFIGMFRKSASQKLQDKIRSLYHIDVRDNGVLAQIVEMAKQYGGNLDMTIRAPQVAELLELYALTTGQQFPMRNIPRPFAMSQSGGSLYQMPTYDRGQAYGYSGLPMFGGASFQPIQSAQNITLQLDPQATQDFLEGRMVTTITKNPEVVASATSEGTSRNVSRRDLAASVLAPGTVLS